MRMRKSFVPAIVIVCLVAVTWAVMSFCTTSQGQFTLKPIPVSAVHHYRQAPHIRNADGTSSNWSGYAVYGAPTSSRKGSKSTPPATVSDVVGSWVMPDVAAGSAADTYSSTWVGIDGYTDNTVEQVGTEQDWLSGSPSYYAWFEMYPKNAYEIVGFPLAPGDTISAEVKSQAKGAFTLTITNTTADVSFSTTQRLQSAQRLSAEWIEEAPWSGGVLPLADFGTIAFFDCWATLNGHTGSVSNKAWQHDDVTMEASSATIKAQPSALSGDGTAFSVTWEHE